MLVVDASVLAPVVADSGVDGRRYRARLRGQVVIAPDLLRVEVASVLRRRAHAGQLAPEQADAALQDLIQFPITVFPTAPFLRRIWDLRANVTAYDGCYVALAEAADATLLTADRRLAGASGVRCVVEVL